MNSDNIITINHKLSDIPIKYCSIEFKENKMFIDGVRVRKNNPYYVTYRCQNCNRINDVILNTFINKVNKGVEKCNMCSGVYNCNEKMDKQYQQEYFKKYPTKEEMKLHWNKILSIQNKKFSNRTMSEFEYYPAIKITNGNSFQPFFKDLKRDVFERPVNLVFKCDCCGCRFTVKDLTCVKNKLKILCSGCSHSGSTKSIKIQQLKNCIGEKVPYFNNFQKRVIKFCNKKGLVIQKKGEYYRIPSWNETFCLLDTKTIEDKIGKVLIMNPCNFHKLVKHYM
jgi:hypothetical protein